MQSSVAFVNEKRVRVVHLSRREIAEKENAHVRVLQFRPFWKRDIRVSFTPRLFRALSLYKGNVIIDVPFMRPEDGWIQRAN